MENYYMDIINNRVEAINNGFINQDIVLQSFRTTIKQDGLFAMIEVEKDSVVCSPLDIILVNKVKYAIVDMEVVFGKTTVLILLFQLEK